MRTAIFHEVSPVSVVTMATYLLNIICPVLSTSIREIHV